MLKPNIFTLALPKINVISLPNRADRKSHIVKEFAEQEIGEWEFWEGVVDSPPFLGIHAAHKKIVSHAKQNKYPFCVIGEDDLKFSCLGAYEYFISKIPTDYDLYLSSIYWGNIQPDNTVDDFSSLTLYVINSRYYDTFLETSTTGHIDRRQKDRGKFVVCNPFTTYQIEGFSDNVKRETDYFQKYMGGRKFYARSVAANNERMAISL